MYLSQVTRTDKLGYALSSLQEEEKELKKESSDLEVETVRLQSIERVKASQVAGALVPIKPTTHAN
jgi:hypothetical protein